VSCEVARILGIERDAAAQVLTENRSLIMDMGAKINLHTDQVTEAYYQKLIGQFDEVKVLFKGEIKAMGDQIMGGISGVSEQIAELKGIVEALKAAGKSSEELRAQLAACESAKKELERQLEQSKGDVHAYQLLEDVHKITEASKRFSQLVSCVLVPDHASLSFCENVSTYFFLCSFCDAGRRDSQAGANPRAVVECQGASRESQRAR
jgi:uncharacterized protein YPO0396